MIPGLGSSPGERIGISLQYKNTEAPEGFPGGLNGKESTCNMGDLGLIPGLGRSPEGGHGKPTPVFLPGESPWREEPGGLQFMGSQRTGHD